MVVHLRWDKYEIRIPNLMYEPSHCVVAALLGIVVSSLLYRFLGDILPYEHKNWLMILSISCIVLTVIFYGINGFRPTFCMSRKERNVDRGLRDARDQDAGDQDATDRQ